jgi:hypothetical protein
MMSPSGEDMRELLVLSRLALHMLQNDFAEFLGVSDRTMRRWTTNSVRLDPYTLHTLVTAVHPKDPTLAARLAAAHGRITEDVLRPFPPARDPATDRRLADALVLTAAQVASVPPPAMRAALVAALGGAQSAGLTLEEAYALFAEARGE